MISVYWKNATAQVVGPHGVSDQELEALKPRLVAAHHSVMDQVEAGHLGYAKLPSRRDYRDGVMALVDKHRPGTTDLVVLGIGGSALGNIALHTALRPATYNLLTDSARGGPRLFVLDNVDPALIDDVLGLLGRRLKTTLVNVISKSGETAETASAFMIFRELLRKRLGDEAFGGRIVATTDLAKGTLNKIAQADRYDMLAVPDDVGGRFSVLSPVGLFSAAMCGIDIDKLLAGAAKMAEKCALHHWHANPATLLAAVHYLMMGKGKPIHVMMPYSNRLYGLADWFRQLWAESLGKAHDRAGQEVNVGPTPVKALGTTDQHSQVQLYREGPNDKLVTFIEVTGHPAEVRIPDVFADVPGLAYLRRKKISALLSAEKAATEFALAKSQRPSLTLRFDAIDEESVGAFFYLYEFVTSLMGELLNINAYDQPAVELGKQATFALMGKEGYEDLAKELKPFAKPDEKFLV
jgi:glucose-6-phosphate isomerase